MKPMQPLHDLTFRQRVALVGNAASIFAKADGKAIDAHDVVIRMNMGLPNLWAHKVESLGTRTDVWATAKHFGIPPRECKLTVFMKLTELGNRDWQSISKLYPTLPMIRWPHELEVECRQFVGADPGTGIRLLWWLKTHGKPASVSTFGMDCWESTSHWSGKKNTPNHMPDLEKAAMPRPLG